VPTETVLVIVPALGAFIVIAPPTVRIFVPLIVIPLLAAGALIVMLAHTAATSTVTITPEFIVTASLEMGTGAPPQVAVLLQLPVTEAVLCAFATSPDSRRIVRIRDVNKYIFFMISEIFRLV
jgi:hypothetical protein